MLDETDIVIQRQSTAEVVAETIMRMIVAGDIQAGAPLRESALSARLGISRNSLREGIRLLEQSRLVKYEVHRGAVVSTPTLKDLEDLYRTRLQIEVLALREMTDASDLGSIDTALANLKAAAQTRDPAGIIAADIAFHESLVSTLGSERMSAFYAQIRKELVFYFTVLSFADEEYAYPDEPIIARHEEIVCALRDSQREMAEELLRAHIWENFDRLRVILEDRAASADA